MNQRRILTRRGSIVYVFLIVTFFSHWLTVDVLIAEHGTSELWLRVGRLPTEPNGDGNPPGIRSVSLVWMDGTSENLGSRVEGDDRIALATRQACSEQCLSTNHWPWKAGGAIAHQRDGRAAESLGLGAQGDHRRGSGSERGLGRLGKNRGGKRQRVSPVTINESAFPKLRQLGYVREPCSEMIDPALTPGEPASTIESSTHFRPQ